MFHSIAEYNNFEIAVGILGALSVASLLIFTKHFVPLLSAIILGSVAGAILLVPDFINYAVVGGCVAGLLLIVVHEVRAHRRETFVQAEIERLSAALSDLENRSILMEVRMAGMRRPAALKIEEIESVA